MTTINPAPNGPVCDLTPSEMFNSLTGFDEIAVAKQFGRPITDFGKKGRAPNPMMLVRALVTVHRKRAHGENDRTAYTAAMSLRADEVQHYFATEKPEPEDDGDDAAEPADLEDDAEGKAPSAA